jgi:hypothetical protein
LIPRKRHTESTYFGAKKEFRSHHHPFQLFPTKNKAHSQGFSFPNHSSSTISQFFNMGWWQVSKTPSSSLHNCNKTWIAATKNQWKVSELENYKSKHEHIIVSAYFRKSAHNLNSMIKMITIAWTCELKIRRPPH